MSRIIARLSTWIIRSLKGLDDGPLPFDDEAERRQYHLQGEPPELGTPTNWYFEGVSEEGSVMDFRGVENVTLP
eukprot:CAMPEP_0197560608 /NCGR_PEP_ID=MMETSP1320-20131121/23503_1 /TAXON_ID=91990 /ORGANISM="Bolidomonas sp., Strain RCC2347" /LENGTH=73 /DNA_ID=CAMNT_0043122165 /DNA_START=79 /DNA_END=300 /DNA_ORIENTATION=-